jgi:hypothetical protein
MIEGSLGRARCATHGKEAHFTCPRCGVFVCVDCRHPTSSAAALLRAAQLAVHADGARAARYCGGCLARPSPRRRLARTVLGAGAALLGLLLVALAFVHL